MSIMAETGLTAAQLAGILEVNAATISRAIRGSRLDVLTLQKIASRFEDDSDSLSVLAAHLYDEIERSGRSTGEIQIITTGRPQDDDIALVIDEARRDEDLKEIIQTYAGLIRKHRNRQKLGAAKEKD